MYQEAFELGRQVTASGEDEGRAVSDSLRRWAPRFHDFGAAAQLAAYRAELERDLAAGAEVALLRTQLAEARLRCEGADAELAALRREVGWGPRPPPGAWRERLLRWRPLAAVYRFLRSRRAVTRG